MKIAFVFHKVDRNNSIEFFKTLFIGIVAQWFMGLKDTSKHRILYGENNNPNKNIDQILNRFENEIRKEFLGEYQEADFQQEVKRKKDGKCNEANKAQNTLYIYLKDYICSFEELYYKCQFDSDENTIQYYNCLYFIEIPDP